MAFEKSMSQSNPMFGRVVYRSNPRELAEKGYTTPLQCIILNQYQNNEKVETNTQESKVKYFVTDLVDAIKDLDDRIKTDSKGQRRAFMFVTVPGNGYLSELYHSKYFNNFIMNEEVGVYMTSSPINHKDSEGNRDYAGGGYIKKAESYNWESTHFKITDFIDIINNKSSNTELNLTKNEINTHINILINIDQCNTGVNLPGLNGVYFGRAIDENDPLFIQIPGRSCRSDSDDNDLIGDENTNAYSENCKYVKPFAYIYLPAGLLNYDEFEQMERSIRMLYYKSALTRIKMIDIMKGCGNKDNSPDNTTKYEHELDLNGPDNRPNWNTNFEKFDLLQFGKDVKYIEKYLGELKFKEILNPDYQFTDIEKNLIAHFNTKAYMDDKNILKEICQIIAGSL